MSFSIISVTLSHIFTAQPQSTDRTCCLVWLQKPGQSELMSYVIVAEAIVLPSGMSLSLFTARVTAQMSFLSKICTSKNISQSYQGKQGEIELKNTDTLLFQHSWLFVKIVYRCFTCIQCKCTRAQQTQFSERDYSGLLQ